MRAKKLSDGKKKDEDWEISPFVCVKIVPEGSLVDKVSETEF
jgi:hypothetical protein